MKGQGMKPGLMARAAAEDVALGVLAWIAADEDLAGRFLDAAGAAPGDLRARSADPEFLGFVLDFLLSDERALIAFAGQAGISPEAPMRARAALPGGDLPNWT